MKTLIENNLYQTKQEMADIPGVQECSVEHLHELEYTSTYTTGKKFIASRVQ